MHRSLRVLFLEDSPLDAELVAHELARAGFESQGQRVDSCAAFAATPLADFDLILADYSLPDGTAVDAFRTLQQSGLDIPFIVITGSIGEERAVELIKLGATDYLLKDRLERLGSAVTRALAEQQLRLGKELADEALRQALAETQESRDRLDRVLQLMADGLLLSGAEGRILHMNAAAERLLATPLAGCAGKSIACLPGGEALLSHLASILDGTAESAIFEWDQPVAAGSELRLQAHSALHRGSDSTQKQIITVVRDITPSHRLALLRNEFVGSAAHELQTPLTSIIGYGELLLQNPDRLPAEALEPLAIMVAKAWTLSKIVDNILLSCQLERCQELELELETFDLSALIGRIADEYALLRGRCTLTLDLPPQPLYCTADPLRIEQVLVNLLSNAFKYSPQGGEVGLSCREEPESLLCSVSDHGLGMTPEQAEQAFDKFYRARSPSSGAGGCGLGLTLVKELVTAHGGEVQIASAAGSGTTVTVKLPRTQRPLH